MNSFKYLLVTAFVSQVAVSQITMDIHTQAGVSSFLISQIDSITFSTIPIDGLVAYYPFNGDATDQSSFGNHGITNGGVSWVSDRFGNANQAAGFDGTSGYIRVPSSPSLNDSSISICAWIFSTGAGSDSWDDIVSKGYDNQATGEYSLLRADISGTLGIEIVNVQSTPYYVNSPAPTLAFNEWYFVAVTYNNLDKTVKLYVNSTEVANGTLPASRRITSNALNIGRRETTTGGSQFLFHGTVDDVRIFNRPLSDVEIKQLYHE